MSRYVSGLLSFACVFALANAASAQMLKSSDEVRAVFVDKTAYITHNNGVKQQAYFAADGKAVVTQKSGKKSATWTIDKNTICHDLSTERKCYTVSKRSDDTYTLQSTDMKWSPTYKMVPGNAEKL